MSEGKIIRCCGDCVQYDYKKHRCRVGHNQEGSAQQHFYQDCTTFEDLAEHDAKIRADALNQLLAEFCTVCDQEACEGGQIGSIQECETIRMMRDLVEELKEQRNDSI